MSENALKEAKEIAEKVTTALGGYGLFGVELFVKGDTAIFSEVSPRPHDTGMVTMITQDLSEFALHARAILGLPIPTITLNSPGASSVILGHGTSTSMEFQNIDTALSEENTAIRIFGKPEINGKRRLGVALARRDTVEEARKVANKVSSTITIEY